MNRAPLSEWLSEWRVPLGFVAAIVYFMLARPTLSSLLVGSSVAFVGVAWRAVASGMIQKNASLALAGPYALSRNPLYFGSFLIAFGFGVVGNELALVVGGVIFFIVVYWPVMRREERQLRQIFGSEYEAYAREVPLFVPWKLKRARRVDERSRFDWGQYWRNREYNVILGYCSAMALLFLIKYLRGS
jgi:protein-S-isoprenylcysteine O-methyltransferase Ste14